MEQRDLYDVNKKLINKTIYKGEIIPENNYILVVVIFIQNKKGEFLIQKRSEKKGGQWANTGGHPKTKESSLQGIISEVKEEIGLDIKNPILFKELKFKNIFCDLYYIKDDFDINDVVMEEEEVQDVKYASIKEIERLYKKGLFKDSHYKLFQECLEYLKY